MVNTKDYLLLLLCLKIHTIQAVRVQFQPFHGHSLHAGTVVISYITQSACLYHCARLDQCQSLSYNEESGQCSMSAQLTVLMNQPGGSNVYRKVTAAEDVCLLGTNNCHINALCTNTDGGFNCSCMTGYDGNGITCADIDECSQGVDICSPDATCVNTDGGYNCACNILYDDVYGNSSVCLAPGAVDCDFETNIMCDWGLTADSNLDWELNHGSTSTASTGPSIDHTIGTSVGWYLYIDATGSNPDEFARFESPILSPTPDKCVIFFYHMYGGAVNQLTLNTRNTSGALEPHWTIIGEQGDEWFGAQVNVVSSTPYRLVFEATAGLGVKGDIAIDDILVMFNPCSEVNECEISMHDCSVDAVCVDTSEGFDCICPSEYDDTHGDGTACSAPGVADCDFEDGLCEWVEATDDELAWTRRSSATTTGITGPSTDHTADGTFFLYIETSSGLVNYAARLESVTLGPNRDMCTMFWYHMYGTGINQLSLYIKNSTGAMSSVWSMSGDQGNRWHLARLDIASSTPYQLVMEALRGDTTLGDIAIDDIMVVFHACTEVDECTFGFHTCHIDAVCMDIREGFNCTCPHTYDDTYGDGTMCTAPGTADCDFEDGICNWIQADDDDLPWTRRSGVTSTGNTGPSSDHSQGGIVYLYLESSNGLANSAARVESVVLSANNSMCTSFWYHMHGVGINKLSLYTKNQKGVLDYQWSMTGEQGDRWLYAQLDISSPSPFQLVFEALRGENDKGDIAIDDITMLYESCPEVNECEIGADNCDSKANCTNTIGSFICTCPATYDDTFGDGSACTAPGTADCDFELGLGNWVQATDDDQTWLRKTGATSTANTGPSSAHEGGSVYLYYDSSYGQANHAVRLESVVLSANNSMCASFWYHMYGDGINKLSMYTKTENGVLNNQWSETGGQGYRWLYAQLVISSPSPFQLVFEALRGENDRGDIAIDDITVLFTSCPEVNECDIGADNCDSVANCTNTIGSFICTCPATFDDTYGDGSACTAQGTADCDFEAGFCNWIQATDDDLSWARVSGATTTSNTGPSSGHEGGTYYINYDSTYGSANAAARLESVVLSANNSMCASFWYHMYGDGINKLSLYTKSESGVLENQWSMTGEQGDRWLYAQLDITSSSPFQLVFEALRGENIRGDIAIDDVTVLFTSCPGINECDIGADNCHIDANCTDTVDSFICTCPSGYDDVYGDGSLCQDPEAASCDFEEGLSTWVQSVDDQDDWVLESGSTPSADTGPSTDHTLQTTAGFYVHIEGTNTNGVSHLESVLLGAAADKCVTFFYHMYGDDIDELNLYTRNASGILTLRWTMYGPQGNVWLSAVVAIAESTPYKLVFEGVDSGVYGDIAIDDITVVNGACPDIDECFMDLHDCHHLANCTNTIGSYNCTCPSHHYDVYGDGSDCTVPEDADCDFEEGLCTWEQSSDDEFDWTLESGPTASTGTGPSADHTLQTALGKYVYIETTNNAHLDSASLQSILLGATPGICVTFFYHMVGNNVNNLTLYSRDSSGILAEEWSMAGQQANEWLPAKVNVTKLVPFSLVITALKGDGNFGDIAIDDIRLTGSPCMAESGCKCESEAWPCRVDQLSTMAPGWIEQCTVGYIVSQNYPSEYDSSTTFSWVIRNNGYSTLKLTLLDFETEPNHDYLWILDTGNKLSGPLPANLIHTYDVADINDIQMEFYSDVNNVATGFRIKFELL